MDLDIFNITVIKVTVVPTVLPITITDDDDYMTSLTTNHISVAITGFDDFQPEEIQFFLVETMQSGVLAYR